MKAGKGGCCVIFLDELDKGMKEALANNSGSAWKIQFLLDMLNSKLEFLKDYYAGFGVPARKIMIIGAGNIELAKICSTGSTESDPKSESEQPIISAYPNFAQPYGGANKKLNSAAKAIGDRFHTITFPAMKQALKADIVQEYIGELCTRLNYVPSYSFKVKFKELIKRDKQPGVRQLTNHATLLFTHDATRRAFDNTILDSTKKENHKYAAVTIQRAWRKNFPKMVARKYGM